MADEGPRGKAAMACDGNYSQPGKRTLNSGAMAHHDRTSDQAA